MSLLHRLYYTILLPALLFSSTTAQPIAPLNATPDPRTSVAGSVRVAAAGDATAWGSNPASIGDSTIIGAFFSKRNLPLLDGELGYSEFGVWWSNRSYGALSVNYSHLNLGEVQQVFQNGHLGAIVRSYHDLLSTTVASPLISGFRLGATLKQVTTSILAVTADDSGFGSLPVYGSGIWCDLGATYQLPLKINGDAEAPLRFGLSLRDLGGDLAYNEPSFSAPVPAWLNVGGMLTIPFPEFEGELGVGVGGLWQLNSIENQPASINDERRSELDAAVQIRAYGLSFRLGLHRQSVDDLYAQQSTISPRYGFGVHLPVRKIGINAPLILDFDYGLLPLHPQATSVQTENVHALQLQVGLIIEE